MKMRTRRQRRQRGKTSQRKKHEGKNEAKKRNDKRFGLYQERNRLLAAMGFPTYGAYLASELWRGIRARVLRRDGWACRFCPGPKNRATLVHHGSYDGPTLRGEKLSKLYACCKPCHDVLELDGHEKLSGAAVLRETRRRIKNAERQEREWRKTPRLVVPALGDEAELEAAGAAVRAFFGLRVECSGTILKSHDKLCCSRRRCIAVADASTVLRLFAADEAEWACKLTGWADPRSIAAIEAARKFARGEITVVELAAANAAAYAYANAAYAAAAYAANAARKRQSEALTTALCTLLGVS